MWARFFWAKRIAGKKVWMCQKEGKYPNKERKNYAGLLEESMQRLKVRKPIDWTTVLYWKSENDEAKHKLDASFVSFVHAGSFVRFATSFLPSQGLKDALRIVFHFLLDHLFRAVFDRVSPEGVIVVTRHFQTHLRCPFFEQPVGRMSWLLEPMHIASAYYRQVLAEGLCKSSGGTSDRTTPSSLVVSLVMMSFDDFLHSKTAIFIFRKYGRTRPLLEMCSRIL